jgi:predicted TIM-barrel fold metal-dependent hydrolase
MALSALRAVVPALALSLAAGGVSGAAPVPADAGAPPAETVPPSADTVAPPADHHVHVWSDAAVDALLEIQEKVGQAVIPPEEARPLGAEEALAGLDSAGIRTGVLLSNAYFFGNPEYEAEDEYREVRAENDYVARQVREAPDRLVAFLSVNPLADYAVREMERLADAPEFVGLKLHLANSDVDLRRDAHVEKLRRVFRRANDLGLAVVIHLFTRRDDYGERDAEIFIDEVLPAAPDVPVQVAHMGGGGGFAESTVEVVDAFAAAREDHPERMDRVIVDLAAVPHPEHLAEGREDLLERIRAINERFLEAVRTLGPDRILYGTDWPAVSMPAYLDGLRESLPMEAEAFRDLVDDRAPYLPEARER